MSTGSSASDASGGAPVEYFMTMQPCQQDAANMMQSQLREKLNTPTASDWSCHLTMGLTNNLDDAIKSEPESSFGCFSCGQSTDESSSELLNVNGRTYHVECLLCTTCDCTLADMDKCHVKNDRVYCRACYSSEFGCRCAKCSRVIAASDWVRRARQLTYHLACFACDVCKRQLSTGEHFALQQRTKLLCKQHYMELIEGDTGVSKSKSKRVRTTFTDEQIAILQTNFQIDSNPDGQDLERIALVTGLSKRVTQVWFQNSRARQKKYLVKPGTAEDGSSQPFDITDAKAFSTTYSDDDDYDHQSLSSNTLDESCHIPCNEQYAEMRYLIPKKLV